MSRELRARSYLGSKKILLEARGLNLSHKIGVSCKETKEG